MSELNSINGGYKGGSPRVRSENSRKISPQPPQPIDVVDMVNKSRGEIAYNIIDVEGELFEDLRTQISAVDGVMRVRFI